MGLTDKNYTEQRPWGFYTVIATGKGFATKILHVNSNQKLSVQSHNHRSEHWVVISGTATVYIDGEKITLSVGESINIPVKSVHSLQNTHKEDCDTDMIFCRKEICLDECCCNNRKQCTNWS